MDLIEIGKISSAHGLKGTFKIERYIDNIDEFENFNSIFVFGYPDAFEVQNVTIKKQSVYIKLDGIDDINSVENIIGCSIYVNRDELRDLDKDQFFHNDLIGLDVIYNSKKIGVVKDIINGVNQDIIVVEHNNDEALIPFVKQFVEDVSKDDGFIKINTIEGLIPWL